MARPKQGGHTKRQSRVGGLTAEVDEIVDSRGQPTLRVTLRLGDAEGTGDVAGGTATRGDEAQTVTVSQAKKNIEKTLLPLIRATDADLRRHESLLEIEQEVIKAAGPDFETLGANAVVPVSRALWQLAAALRKMSLCAYLIRYEPALASSDRVGLFFNVFHGGFHAAVEGEKPGVDRIDIQEIMIIPTGASNFRDALAMGERIDATLEEILERTYGAERVTRGAEAGFTVAGLGQSETAIAHVIEAIERSGYIPGEEVQLAFDVAATRLYDDETKTYAIGGESLDSDGMVAYLCALVDRWPGKVQAIEDGLGENDWEGWTKLTTALGERGVLSIGDDLFVTQVRRLRRGVNNDSAHGILVKVSQNGSVSGALDVMRYAKETGMRCIVSHRAAETLDDSIADLAIATGALGLKAGAPQPETEFPESAAWVRRCKYLRMILIEETLRR